MVCRRRRVFRLHQRRPQEAGANLAANAVRAARTTKGIHQAVIEPNDSELVKSADNLTVAPWGDLIICEDGASEQFLVGVTPEGRIYKFARNASQFVRICRATFAPDGGTLFVNIPG